ncbi:Thioesterase/thiol ester dehydrase-isomerase [Aureobasidium sp. EXF-10727]|nr:Thioesterase/thiol ester dehydrase-isomerase [Aureobasidium sp. EXF-10727]
MSGPGVGFEYPSVPVSWYKRDVLLFANAIGCDAKDELHFLYEFHPKFSTFPTYSIILPFKGTSAEIIDFYASQNSKRAVIPDVPKFDSRRVVHGEQSITFLKPLPPTSEGREFEMRAKVLGVYDKGKPGSVVETENLIVDKATGEVYSRAVGMSFFVGQGGWNGPKGPKTVNYPPPEGKKPDAEYVFQTNAESAHLYRLCGDYNPLHATPEPGQQMGFGGAILHGLFSWNTTAHGLLKLLGNSDPTNIKEFAARFASPVKAGDTLVTQIWRMGNIDQEGWEEVRFVTSVKGGKVCLSNGRAKMKITGQKSKL